MDWETLRLFLAVARDRSLRKAAARLDKSGPTLGRQIERLERSIGERLFERQQTGLTLTAAGETLYGHVLEMERVAEGIEHQWSDDAPFSIVRISSGYWTARFLAQHIGRIRAGSDRLTLEFVTTPRKVDIVRRQADIGFRNQAPDDLRLITRRLHEVAFAVYRSSDDASSDPPWIAAAGDTAVTPSARWAAREHGGQTGVLTTDPGTILDLVRGGGGRAVLPCFVGDSEPGLVRMGETIAELRGPQWLVLNDRTRHDPAVRTTVNRLIAVLKDHRPLIEGSRPRNNTA